ncbi:hypothetical protein [Pseudomonas aeruginosa]|uniref:hypothetical protein n=1 Tax=Pseudomonas aeruginosa TaxID=287 RepID=UPI00104897BB|nr:hypothetical protein [Pseudomonas aeruginosa]
MTKPKNIIDLPVPDFSDKLIEQLKSEIVRFTTYIKKIESDIASVEQHIRELKISAFDAVIQNPESAPAIRQEIAKYESEISKKKEKLSEAKRKISIIKNLSEKK